MQANRCLPLGNLAFQKIGNFIYLLPNYFKLYNQLPIFVKPIQYSTYKQHFCTIALRAIHNFSLNER